MLFAFDILSFNLNWTFNSKTSNVLNTRGHDSTVPSRGILELSCLIANWHNRLRKVSVLIGILLHFYFDVDLVFGWCAW